MGKQWCFLLGNLFGVDLISGLGIKVLLASNFVRKSCLTFYLVVHAATKDTFLHHRLCDTY